MRILAFGCVHLPATHPKALQFCKYIYKKWNCNAVVCLGDLIDGHAVGFWDSDPSLPQVEDEFEMCRIMLKPWIRAFPKLHLTIGNHDARIYRRALKAGIPDKYLKSYNEITGTPKTWKWVRSVDLDGVHFTHGSGRGGMYPSVNKARYEGRAVVMAHIHAAAGVWYSFSSKHRFFGMNVGSLVDDKHRAFEYASETDKKSALGCGVIINGTPYWEPMPIGDGERYNRHV